VIAEASASSIADKVAGCDAALVEQFPSRCGTGFIALCAEIATVEIGIEIKS
jgi:hypothetical protein